MPVTHPTGGAQAGPEAQARAGPTTEARTHRPTEARPHHPAEVDHHHPPKSTTTTTTTTHLHHDHHHHHHDTIDHHDDHGERTINQRQRHVKLGADAIALVLCAVGATLVLADARRIAGCCVGRGRLGGGSDLVGIRGIARLGPVAPCKIREQDHR